MNGVLSHDSTLRGYAGPGTTWANEMNFVTNHALVQDRSLDLLSSSSAHYQFILINQPTVEYRNEPEATGGSSALTVCVSSVCIQANAMLELSLSPDMETRSIHLLPHQGPVMN